MRVTLDVLRIAKYLPARINLTKGANYGSCIGDLFVNFQRGLFGKFAANVFPEPFNAMCLFIRLIAAIQLN